MTTITEFVTDLQTLLAADVGIYTTKSGQTQPAFYVVPPQVPSDWKVTGLEVIVSAQPEIEKEEPVTGGVYIRGWWVVRLVMWDTTRTTEAAKDKMIAHFPVTRSLAFPGTDLAYDQAVVKVFNPVIENRV